MLFAQGPILSLRAWSWKTNFSQGLVQLGGSSKTVYCSLIYLYLFFIFRRLWWSRKIILFCLLATAHEFHILQWLWWSCKTAFWSLFDLSVVIYCLWVGVMVLEGFSFVPPDFLCWSPASVIAHRVFKPGFWSTFLLEEVVVLKGLDMCSVGVSLWWAIHLGVLGVAMILVLWWMLVLLWPAVLSFAAYVLGSHLIVWGLLRHLTAWRVSASFFEKSRGEACSDPWLIAGWAGESIACGQRRGSPHCLHNL